MGLFLSYLFTSLKVGSKFNKVKKELQNQSLQVILDLVTPRHCGSSKPYDTKRSRVTLDLVTPRREPTSSHDTKTSRHKDIATP